jgi:hypothetical protein
VRRELGRSVPLLVLFTAGLAAGIWLLVSPWALGYPTAGGWTSSIWGSTVAGAAVTLASGASLVTVMARGVYLALLPRGDGP